MTTRQGRAMAWIIVVGFSGIWSAILLRHNGIAWHFFATGGRLLTSGPYGENTRPGGLRVYSSYPYLQIGPLALAVAGGLIHVGPRAGKDAAEAFMGLLGFVALWLIHGLAPAASRVSRRTIGDVLFMAAWLELAIAYGHLDDALAIVAALGAVRLARDGRVVWAGLLLGVAIDAKPWALELLPLLYVTAPAPHRRPTSGRLLVALLTCSLVVLAAWLPFYAVGDHLHAFTHYTIVNLPQSPLRFLGADARRTPPWDRPAQLAVGLTLGLIAVRRGRWAAVFFIGTMARVALDPATHGYYTSGPLAGALILDTMYGGDAIPLWSASTFVALNLVQPFAPDSALVGAARVALLCVGAVALLARPRHSTPTGIGPKADAWHPPGMSPRRVGITAHSRGRDRPPCPAPPRRTTRRPRIEPPATCSSSTPREATSSAG